MCIAIPETKKLPALYLHCTCIVLALYLHYSGIKSFSKILLSDMYFMGKIKYKQTQFGFPIIEFGVDLKIAVKNPTALYCRSTLETDSTAFSCGGCVLLCEEVLEVSVKESVSGSNFKMGIYEPIIGICAKTENGISGTYCNISTLVSTSIDIPGCPNFTINATPVYSSKLT